MHVHKVIAPYVFIHFYSRRCSKYVFVFLIHCSSRLSDYNQQDFCVVNKPLTPQKGKYNVNDNGISYRYKFQFKKPQFLGDKFVYCYAWIQQSTLSRLSMVEIIFLCACAQRMDRLGVFFLFFFFFSFFLLPTDCSTVEHPSLTSPSLLLS